MYSEEKDTFFFDTCGFSMWPFMKSGEKVIVKKIPVTDLKFGDIILYRARDKLICHRLIGRQKKHKGYLLYSRADAALSFLPEPVTEEMFLGKVSAIIKNGKIINIESRGQRMLNQVIALFSPFFIWAVKIVQVFFKKR